MAFGFIGEVFLGGDKSSGTSIKDAAYSSLSKISCKLGMISFGTILILYSDLSSILIF